MRKIVAVAVLIAVGVMAGACSREGAKGADGKKAGLQVHADKAAAPPTELQGMVGAVKKQTLLNYTSKTIGEAFDAYRHLNRKEWKESASPDGKLFVDFSGWVKAGLLDAVFKKSEIKERGLHIRFVVQPDGAFYVGMISKIEVGADGGKTESSLGDQKSILDAIYTNRQLSF